MARIVHLVTLAEYGGAQKIVYHLASTQASYGHEVTVMAGEGEELWQWLNRAGKVGQVRLPYLRRSISIWRDLITLVVLYRYFRQHSPEIVHCHSSKAGILGRLAARLAGIPAIVFTVHGWGFSATSNPLLRKLYFWLEKKAATWGDAMVFVAEKERQFGSTFGISSRYNLTIPNGLPLSRRWGRKEARLLLGLPENACIIGTVGRLSQVKNPLYFLETLAGLAAEQEFLFIWVGDGPMLAAAERRAAELGLAERCRFVGYQEDTAPWLAVMDIFLLLSRSEALPLVVIEAMQQGLPVIAHAVGGIGEMVQDGVNGYLVCPGDQAAVISRLKELCRNQEKIAWMGKNGEEIARTRFGLETMTEKYLSLYTQLLQEKGRGN